MHKRLLAPCSIVRVQTWDREAIPPAAIEGVVGVAWPQKTGTAAAGRAEVICVGPADWLVMAAQANAIEWLELLKAVLEDSPFRATDISLSLARIEIEGTEVHNLLAKCCALDLRPFRFAPGRAARTRFAGMPVIACSRSVSKFECIVTRSYAEYLLTWLADAALEFESVD